MANLYKLEIYVSDYNSAYNAVEDILCDIENGLYDGSITCFNAEKVEIEWNDDIDINYSDATKEDYDKYFE